jgi:serine protease Do
MNAGPIRMRSIRSPRYPIALAGLLLALPALRAMGDSPAVALARQLNQAFIEVADKVSPAVVIIEVAHRPDYLDDDQAENPLLDMLPPDARRRFEDHAQKQRQEHFRHHNPIYDGHGSGVVIRPDGWILTNNHVVDGAERIRVKFKDGKTYESDGQWWTDPQSDIAVIKVPAKDLTTAVLGDSSKTRVGEFAIAIGAPFELDYSVTFGHVSAKGRTHIIETVPGAAMDQDFIQTDASINPGNSGGPLVNIDGEVIGVNTLIRGMNRGIGFAIPSNLAKQVAGHLITDGKFTRAWLGIQISALREDADFRNLLPGINDGVVVRRIMPNGPAARSGLKPADVITAVEGTPVATAQQLRNEIRARRIGSKISLQVIRPDKVGVYHQVPIALQTEVWPDETTTVAAHSPKPEPDVPSGLGLTVQSLSKKLAEKYTIELVEGVVVTAVQPDSPAEEQGFKPGDVITTVDDQPVSSPQAFKELVKAAGGKRLLIHLVSNGAPEFRILKDSGD